MRVIRTARAAACRTALLLLLVPMLAVLLQAGPAAAQGRRVAFVVGIDSYTAVTPLTRARNDATAVAERLRATGFEVVLRTDADRRAINDGMSEFEDKLRGAEVGFFFFAGHGVEIRGTNVLLPADLPATLSETVVLREGLLLADVAQLMSDSGVRYSVLVIDACRDNPLPRNSGRSVGRTRGLGRADAPRGTYVVYSAGIGEAALDRLSDQDASPNSVFTRHLLPALANRGVSLDSAVKQVREQVRADAASVRHQQNPAIYDQATGELFLVPTPPAPPGPAAEAPRAAGPGPTPDGSGAEMLFWQSVQGTNRPSELEAYLARWPDGIFAPLARSRLAALSAATPVPPAASAAPPRPSQPIPGAESSAPAQPVPARIERGEIRQAQLRLARLGLDPGPADGEPGPRTVAAARAFRAATGLPPEGEDITPALVARLAAEPPPSRPDLARALFAAAAEARGARQGAEASRLLDLGLRLQPDPGALLTLGDVQRELGQVEPARRSWTNLRRQDPNGEAGRAAAERLAALPAPRAEPARPGLPGAGAVASVPAPRSAGRAGGACGVSFVGSRTDPAAGSFGYTFANGCDVEMIYRAQCAANSHVGRGDLSLPPRGSTTVWVAGRGRNPGSCVVVSSRQRG
ncbi:caspase family protein [Muricoccus radiodurans]|uniref:caspase family protein n=1 Tax=Muricoccus radiodurans TaxID=2231721 RepID=UPI003CF792FA